MINVMRPGGDRAAPSPGTRVAGRPRHSRLTVRSPAPNRRRFTQSLAKAFYWQGWKTVGAVAASLVAISTAVAAISGLFISLQTLEANTRQQSSDRFGKAIEQLGSDKLDIRLGGIYGLEELARDSPSEQPAVVDVLTAFVRGHAPQATGKCSGAPLAPGATSAPSVDIQTAIDAIARRDPKGDRDGQIVDLSGTCLLAANLIGLQLVGAQMSSADLRGASLTGADLHNAILIISTLSGADLSEAKLNSARISGCRCQKADFRHADLTNADLRDADLAGADLAGANLEGAALEQAELTGIFYDTTTIWPRGFQPPPSVP
jgi:Pentapeptide repeats (8 copies)